MNVQVFRTKSEEETVEAGQRLARLLGPREVVLLIGDLGAGKTTFAKGVVHGLGAAAPEDVVSPTFTLIHEYGSEPKIYHIDLYRIQNEHEASALGLEELLDSEGIILVEWGERFPYLWPPERVEVHFQWLSEQEREIRVLAPQPTGDPRRRDTMSP
jgi:tRNA threonylcarbamoyladenosine biosynthesis protein TsaE